MYVCNVSGSESEVNCINTLDCLQLVIDYIYQYSPCTNTNTRIRINSDRYEHTNTSELATTRNTNTNLGGTDITLTKEKLSVQIRHINRIQINHIHVWNVAHGQILEDFTS